MVPTRRITTANNAPKRPERAYVLYWMTASRRLTWNHAIDRCVDLARELGKPVLVFEAIRCDYQHASDRLHAFIIDGMRDNAAALSGTTVGYYPYVEPTRGDGQGLLKALAGDACVVVTDDFPAFMLPRMINAAANQLDVRLEKVDSNSIMPIRLTEKVYARAYDYRRYMQREISPWLAETPQPRPRFDDLPQFSGLPAEVVNRWPVTDLDRVDLGSLPIDHAVPVVAGISGGAVAAEARLASLDLSRYGSRSHPDEDVTSGLSPYLHFGHISAHEIFDTVATREAWDEDKLAQDAVGSRAGWWGMSETAEGFLDQLITWRELGFNMCANRTDYLDYESLPGWALKTLADHADDPREWAYSLEEFEEAQTHDNVWNAAQNQLRGEGRLHNYMRMLWGKKILHWSESPQQALAIMLHLNDRWAIDGRDPNSASGIFWVLGRYDRAWGPEREIFGKIRYMTVKSARSKLRLKKYVERWA